MTMVDGTADVDTVAEAAEPTSTDDDDASFRAALAERLGLDQSEPREQRQPGPAGARESDRPSDAASEESSPDAASASGQEPSVDYAVLSRRELRQHVTTRDQELQKARDAHAQLETEAAELRRYRDERVAQLRSAYDALGVEAGWDAIAEKVDAARKLDQDPSYYLSDDELTLYQKHLPYREAGLALWEIAEQERALEAHKAAMERVERHGLDPKVIARDPTTGALIDHAVDVTTKRVTDQFKDRLAEKDAEIKSLNDRLVGRSKDPGVGGRASAGDRPGAWASSDSAEDNMLAGIRLRVTEQESSRRRRL